MNELLELDRSSFWNRLKIKIEIIFRRLYRFIYPVTHIKIRKLDRLLWHDRDSLMFHAMFQILVDYMEREVGRPRRSDSSFFDYFVFYCTPRSFSEQECRHRALNRLATAQHQLQEDGIDGIDGPLDIQNTAMRADKLISLYTWYKDYYSQLSDIYSVLPEPEYHFIDHEGNPSNEMFSKDGSGHFLLNKFNQEYIEYLSELDDLRRQQIDIFEEKLEELMSLRTTFWI